VLRKQDYLEKEVTQGTVQMGAGDEDQEHNDKTRGKMQLPTSVLSTPSMHFRNITN